MDLILSTRHDDDDDDESRLNSVCLMLLHNTAVHENERPQNKRTPA